MPGIRISETITSKVCSARRSSAAGPLMANCISHSCRIERSIRSNPCSTLGSSSTKRIFFIAPLLFLQGKVEYKRRAGARLRFEVEGPSVLLYDNGVGNSQPLPRPLTDFFGGE